MIFHRAIAIAILALTTTTTAVAANHHPPHSPTSWQTDFPTAKDHHPNLRTYQNTTSSLHGKGSSDDSCEDPEVYCGMSIPAGKTFTLKKDLVCTTATAGKDNANVAITIEEGATLNCNGHHVTQLNDEVGKAVECTDDPVTVTGCGLAWGAVGVELESGARVENCRVSGWQYGLLIAPPAGGYAKEIKIDNCEVTLNRYGLYAFAGDELDVLDFSIENSYFHHNYDGIYASVLPSTSKVKMEDVKSNFNIFDGIRLTLDEGSELTMDDMEASYNGNDGINLRVPPGPSAPLSTSAAKVSSRVPTLSFKIKLMVSEVAGWM